MAAENGREGADLSEALFAQPHRFDFFQAVRLLRWLGRERSSSDPRWSSHQPGQDVMPDQEEIRFRALPSLSFPGSSLAHASQPEPSPRAQTPRPPVDLVVGFLGLTGPNGVLPQHYTTMLLQRIRE